MVEGFEEEGLNKTLKAPLMTDILIIKNMLPEGHLDVVSRRPWGKCPKIVSSIRPRIPEPA